MTEITDGNMRRWATYASMGVAATLILAKFIAYLETGSVALLSSLFDSASDLVASMITAYGVASALRPPDRKHRFGHGKSEPLAALVQAVFIIGSSFFLAYEAIDRLIKPRAVENDIIGVGVMLLAIALTVALVLFQKKVIAKTGSTAISADRLHYVGDVAVNLAVIAALVLRHYTGIEGFDPLFALGITGGLLFSAYKILRAALAALLDEELPQEHRDKIRSIVLSQEGAQGLHDMRTRTDGGRIFIELHVEMDGNMTLQSAHDLAERVIGSIEASFPNADILVHQDPVGEIEDRLDDKIEKGDTI